MVLLRVAEFGWCFGVARSHSCQLTRGTRGWCGSNREPGIAPGLETSNDIAHVLEAEVYERRGSEARGVAVVAEEDDVLVKAGDVGAAPVTLGIQAPLQNGAGNVQRARDDAVMYPVGVGPNVDDYRATLHGGTCLSWLESLDPGLRFGEQLLNGASLCGL